MKQIQVCLALAVLLFAGLNCGTETPIEEIGDTLVSETGATGAFYGTIEIIEGETVYMRLLKAGQLLAQMEFVMDGVKTARQAEFSGSITASTLSGSGVGNYHIKEAEIGDYTLQVSAKGYETKELTVTVIADQRISLDKIALVALERPVSHLQGILTDVATGASIPQVHLQLTDESGKIYEALTTEAGVFTFENLPIAQAFTLKIEHRDYENAEIEVKPIPASETFELDLKLIPLPEAEELVPGQGLSLGSKGPDFELSDGEGKVHKLTDYIGNKKVALIFFRGVW